MKKLVAIILAVAMVMAVVPAYAATKTVEGEGKLFAKGNGGFKMAFESTSTVDLIGKGNLEIVDETGTAKIRLIGKANKVIKNGNKLVYKGFRGKIRIRGEQLNIAFKGHAESLFARGKGKAVFKGRWVLIREGRQVPLTDGSEVEIAQ